MYLHFFTISFKYCVHIHVHVYTCIHTDNWIRGWMIKETRGHFVLKFRSSNTYKHIQLAQNTQMIQCYQPTSYLSTVPWIFLGAPLNFNGAPRNIQGNLTGTQPPFTHACTCSNMLAHTHTHTCMHKHTYRYTTDTKPLDGTFPCPYLQFQITARNLMLTSCQQSPK